MTDGQLLFAVFAGLYLLECVRVLPLNARVCHGRAKERWHLQSPLRELSGRGRALLLLRPLPPFDAHFITMPWLFVPRGGQLEVIDGNGRTREIDWSKIDASSAGGTLWLNRELSVPLLSEEHANEWERRITEWRALDAAERDDAFLCHAAETLDAKKTAELSSTLTERTRALRSNGAWILVWCFGVIAGVYAWLGEAPQLWAALAGLVLMQSMQAVIFWRAAGREGGIIKHRFWKALAIALMPQHSIRAADNFRTTSGIVPHPLATRELLREKDFHALMVRTWREARYRKRWEAPDEPLPIEAIALQRFFKREKIDGAFLEAAPARDGSSEGYCPRCHTLFQSSAGECADCEGVGLKAF